MFKEMVPEYVVKKMLAGEQRINDPCDTVTVLFVLIDSFNEYTRRGLSFRLLLLMRTMGPGQLLQFLNEYFRRMAPGAESHSALAAKDDICRRNSVTKIETVAEEYVACVGVTDSDKDEQKDKGSHAVLLSKLMKVSEALCSEIWPGFQGDLGSSRHRSGSRRREGEGQGEVQDG